MSTGRMETMEPPESTSGGAGDVGEPDVSETGVPEPEAVAPPVVAVVVTTGDGGLEAALGSLAGQDYPALSVLVLDDASDADPTARIAASLPTAYVRRLGTKVGFAAAANEALRTVEGATFLLFCHDDVAFDPDAVRVMVEEAYRSNAAIVGPKLVDYDHPEILLEVGMAVDHYAVPFSAIEPGEIDQEQHDGVRDVFFVSHAVLLVRADLFGELGGFDVQTSPGSDDIDLCWRARLAGARVLVAPASRVRHRHGLGDEERLTRRQPPRDARAATRARVRVLVKSYSALALLWVLPSGFVLTLGEAFGLVITRRGRHAAAVITGWVPRRGGLGDLRRARSATQKMRSVDDGDIRDLMIRGSARFRSLLVQRLHASDRLADASNRARARMVRTQEQVRRAPAMLAVFLGVLIAVGSRVLVAQRVPDIGTFQAWPGVGSLWSTFISPWRSTMVGARDPATPAFAMMAVLSGVLLGHGGLARTVVVVAALPTGAWGAYRLVRTLTASLLPSVVAAAAYAANPVGRDAIARGDLGPLVCYALAPFVLHALVRLSANATSGGAAEPASPTTRTRWKEPVHIVIVVGLLGAVAGSVWPPATLLAVVLALVLILSVPFIGDGRAMLRTAAYALIGAVISVALLAPWSWSFLGADASTLGLRVRAPMSLGTVLRFDVGPARSGWFTLGLIVTAAVPLLIASGPRLMWATRAWLLTITSFALAWLPGRLSATLPVAAPDGVLVLAALGLAFAAGLGVSALHDDMRRSRFGWRQVSAVAAAVGLAFPLLAFVGDTASGRWQLPSSDWPTAVSWMRDLPSAGGFRVLWLGDPSLLPVDAKSVDGIGYGLTRDGPGDARSQWAAPQHAADDQLAEALIVARGGETARLGHLLAPIAVRYVAVVSRAGPGHGAVIPADATLADALTRQLDLSVSRIDDGAIIYSNDAWIPRRAVVAPNPTVTATAGSGLQRAARRDTTIRPGGVVGPVLRSAPTGPGTLLWAEAANPGWHARADGRDLTRTNAFDWTNAFALPTTASVAIQYRAGALPGLLIDVEIAAWLAAIAIWHRTRTKRRRSDRTMST
jgi:GT2 family glycosyltransferase